MGEAETTLSFPRRFARTARFTAGVPRAFQAWDNGFRVAFLRSGSGTDRAGALWVLDGTDGSERLVADPVQLLAGAGEQLTAAERAIRERMREAGAGITAYSTDRDGRVAAFTLSSRLWVVDLVDPAARARELPAAVPVMDPQVSPDGRLVSYVSGGAVHVTGVADPSDFGDVTLLEPDSPTVSYGLAEFAAAEELGRFRGLWWAPGSDALLVTRADTAPVRVLHIADPANPEQPAAQHRYPAAGTPNAQVTALLVRLDGTSVPVHWDTDDYEYLAAVHWSAAGPPLLQVLSRRQDRAAVLGLDAEDGTTQVLAEQSDPCWVDVVPGVPAWSADRQLLTVEVVADQYALCADGSAVSPPGVQVRSVLVAGGRVLVNTAAGPGGEQAHEWSAADGWHSLTRGPGVDAAVAGTATIVVLASTGRDDPMVVHRVVMTSPRGPADQVTHLVRSLAHDPGLRPRPVLGRLGARDIPTAVLFPTGWRPAAGPLPVLLDPYGGPHHAQVRDAARFYLESQWWADQGFCVVLADGRGTPGTPSWERAVRFDLAGPPLADQVEALAAAAAAHPGTMDLSRVAIRGWSFGGYLAALAVLTRPEVFHAAVAGAPVTQWSLYDTAYTERYLGLPSEHPEAYARGDLVELAPGLRRPLMIIHGLADDNVLAANSLRLSSALLAAGRPHTFLPLSGVTHMTPQEVVAENLLLLQLQFLRQGLGLSPATG